MRYNLIGPLSHVFFLALVAYINPLFLSVLATWLSTFFSGTGHILLPLCSGQEWE